MFNKIETKKMYMKIVEQIRDLIKEDKLKPGDKLPPEQVLAKQFGTSRPSVREALSALEILGIIDSRGVRGNFIKNNNSASVLYEQSIAELQSEESPFELLEARKTIETEIASLAAKKANSSDIKELAALLQKMEDITDDVSKMMVVDREYHLNIASATHNNFLYSVMFTMNQLLEEKLWTTMKERIYKLPGYSKKYINDHTLIFEAIKNKNSEQAKEKMLLHLSGIEKDMLE
jgi:GntR family transcriptional repressor for pyruvate dehydrogenase complex